MSSVTKQPPAASPAEAAARVVITKVFVRGLAIEARIGVHAHEKHRPQPLLVDVELDVAAAGWRALSHTVNYEAVVAKAKAIAAAGHTGLVESFAHRLAMACLEEPRVTR